MRPGMTACFRPSFREDRCSPFWKCAASPRRFPGVKALTDVNLSVMPGEIHAVVGENGAGKSTLMKVLSGVYPHGSYDGEIFFDGTERKFTRSPIPRTPASSSSTRNWRWCRCSPSPRTSSSATRPPRAASSTGSRPSAAPRNCSPRSACNEHPNTLITNLGTGKQQLVEIAKALNKSVKLLILDEPTSSLNETDSNALLALLQEFRAQGISSILITHKLNEVMKVADRITVIRDGRTVDTLDTKTAKVSEDRIIKAMVGRELTDRYPPRHAQVG